MKLRKRVYLIHRWLGLIISVQLLAWSIGGLVFSLLDIEDVRGNRDRAARPATAVDIDSVQLSPSAAMRFAADAGAVVTRTEQVVLRQGMDGPHYILMASPDDPICSIDAVTGAVTTRITPDTASAGALADFAHDATVRSVALIEDEAPTEYRGKRLPAYQVVLDHPKEPHIYVCAVTGDVTSRRNGRWRVFDFFWMLHIMDYDEREDFNHWLLSTASVLAVLTALTGLSLWTMRLWPRTRGAR